MNMKTRMRGTMMNKEISDLIDSIKSNNKQKTVEILNDLKDRVLIDESLAIEIILPETITNLHKLLIDHMSVHPRAMMLRVRIANKKRRANVFLQAMINGVNLSK